MHLGELKRRLDQIAWHEQVEQEMGERALGSPADPALVETELIALAGSVDSALLDALEREGGYVVWTLRLAAIVEPAGVQQRALRHVDDANWRLRHWARLLAQC
jgi:hypothetical protein